MSRRPPVPPQSRVSRPSVGTGQIMTRLQSHEGPRQEIAEAEGRYARAPKPWGGNLSHAPVGGLLPAWAWQLDPAIKAAYSRALSPEQTISVQLDAARDLMDRAFGKAVAPTIATIQGNVDHRHSHLMAVQQRNAQIEARAVDVEPAELEQEADEYDPFAAEPYDPFAI